MTIQTFLCLWDLFSRFSVPDISSSWVPLDSPSSVAELSTFHLFFLGLLLTPLAWVSGGVRSVPDGHGFTAAVTTATLVWTPIGLTPCSPSAAGVTMSWGKLALLQTNSSSWVTLSIVFPGSGLQTPTCFNTGIKNSFLVLADTSHDKPLFFFLTSPFFPASLAFPIAPLFASCFTFESFMTGLLVALRGCTFFGVVLIRGRNLDLLLAWGASITDSAFSFSSWPILELGNSWERLLLRRRSTLGVFAVLQLLALSLTRQRCCIFISLASRELSWADRQ